MTFSQSNRQTGALARIGINVTLLSLEQQSHDDHAAE
jgi:hypothetical protein